ncbi:hypothetical protein SUGI_1455330 [Cryptomeria japonica]|uniref:Uncharacterized protein n=1 Tax=Cryptomeria japonica TaxID=3369 RepID=A0AAD3NT68_CRYJA|nr:hypothetical protein SUGI_1424920 [Cryptomeria japonica]GLJ58517.1 hypothetical protein SUGI_1455330 [Cryptomeria japonica]
MAIGATASSEATAAELTSGSHVEYCWELLDFIAGWWELLNDWFWFPCGETGMEIRDTLMTRERDHRVVPSNPMHR